MEKENWQYINSLENGFGIQFIRIFYVGLEAQSFEKENETVFNER